MAALPGTHLPGLTIAQNLSMTIIKNLSLTIHYRFCCLFLGFFSGVAFFRSSKLKKVAQTHRTRICVGGVAAWTLRG
jgi:hypothetical protein